MDSVLYYITGSLEGKGSFFSFFFNGWKGKDHDCKRAIFDGVLPCGLGPAVRPMVAADYGREVWGVCSLEDMKQIPPILL
jgi:hypothetical protein